MQASALRTKLVHKPHGELIYLLLEKGGRVSLESCAVDLCDNGTQFSKEKVAKLAHFQREICIIASRILLSEM